jgi:hypothetical protein
MNSRDEDLTLENVDERVEQLLHEGKHAGAPAPLAHTVRDLQRVYDEERRLEHVWERISSRAQSLESTIQLNTIEMSSTIQSFQGEQKTMQDTSSSTGPGSFQDTPDGPLQPKHLPRRRNWRNLGLGLAAAIVLIAIFAWTLAAVYHGTQTGSGGGTPVPAPTSAPRPTPTQAPVTPTPRPTSTQEPVTPTPAPTQEPSPTPTQAPVTPTPAPSPTPTQ